MNRVTPEAKSRRSFAAPAASKEIGFLGNPSYLLLTTAGTILAAEIVIMMLLPYLPPLAPFQDAILDAVSLTLLMFPSLYFFVFKPLNRNIERRRRAEAEKDALIGELNKALSEVKTLRGIVPICASCKKVRDDKGFWHQVEVYVSAHSDALFSHGLCPECAVKLYPTLVNPDQRSLEQKPESKAENQRD